MYVDKPAYSAQRIAVFLGSDRINNAPVVSCTIPVTPGILVQLGELLPRIVWVPILSVCKISHPKHGVRNVPI